MQRQFYWLFSVVSSLFVPVAAVAAQRETEQLKGKLERMVEKQRSRDEEMVEVRDHITDLKGQIANNLKSLELKSISIAELRAKIAETESRKQVQPISNGRVFRWFTTMS